MRRLIGQPVAAMVAARAPLPHLAITRKAQAVSLGETQCLGYTPDTLNPTVLL